MFQAKYILDNKKLITDKYEEISANSGISIETPQDEHFYQKNIKIVKQIEEPQQYVFGGIIRQKIKDKITTDDIQLFTADKQKTDTYAVFNKQLLMLHNMGMIPVEKIHFFYKIKSNLYQNDCNISIFNNLPKYFIDENITAIFNVCVSDTYNHKTDKK